MRDIEQKISPLVQSMFPSFYQEEGPNFIAFVQAYYEWLENNFQLLQLEDPTNFNVGDTVYQQDVTGTIINYVGSNILVQINGFNTFKCYNVCSELIPITSSSGGNTYILTGGNSKRLSPLYMSRNLTKLRDIDKTLDLFVINFKEKYLKNIEFDTSSNKQLLVKNSLDLYRSKGTERSIDLFFRLIYGIKSSVEYPGERLFTLSAGEWYSPSYLEVSSESVNRNIELVGKQITGVTSGATAFVEKYVKRKVSSGFVHLLYISNIKGDFLKNELLKSDVAYADSPKVLGSLSDGLITSGGMDYSVGDVVSFTSSSGNKGQARVTGIKDKNGTIEFELVDNGWGFTVSDNSTTLYSEPDRTQTLVSDKLLTLNAIETGNTIQTIKVLNQGFSYSDTDVVRIISPTVNATARIVTAGGGAIQEVVLTNPGGGFFTVNPIIEVVDQTGSNIITGQDATFELEFAEPKQYFRILDTTSQSQTNSTGKLIYSADDGFVTLSNISGILAVGDILYQIGTYGESAKATITEVLSSSLVSTQVKVKDISGVFLKHKSVYVLNSTITAEFKDMSLVVGISNIVGEYSKSYDVLFKYSGTKAKFQIESTGNNANYEVGSISNPETIYLNTDLLNSNNSLNEPFMDIPLNSFQFGFDKNNNANINDVIFSALKFEPFTVGSISTLSDLNPGENYSTDPKTLTYQPYLIGHHIKDYIFKIENLERSFAPNEEIFQSYEVTNLNVELSQAVSLSVGEKIYTGNSTHVASEGIVKSANQDSNSIVITNYTNTITTSQNLYSFSNTLLNADIISINEFADEVTAKAIIKEASDNVIYASRIQYENLFDHELPITGRRSGATASIIEISEDDSVRQIGYNSNIDATADSTEGAIANIKIIDSGFGYQNNQELVLSSNTNISSGSAIGFTSGIGRGIGYYKTSKGFLSSLSKLHDGDYYQEYSYEIFSRIPVDKYSTMFKKVMHTAGTRFFGSILIDSIVDSNTSVLASEIMIMDGASPYTVEDRNDIEVQDRTNIQIEIRE